MSSLFLINEEIYNILIGIRDLMILQICSSLFGTVVQPIS